MTTLTPNFALPYPDALDEPCEFAQDWCAFTDAVNAIANRFQATVNRTTPVIPMARMTLTTPVTLADGSILPFDSVSVNTAGWIDFDNSATNIVTDRAGVFVAVADATFATLDVGIHRMQLGINSGIPIIDGILDYGFGPIAMNVSHIVALNAPFTHNVRVAHNNVGSPITINKASFSVWWHADTATP